MMRLGTSRHRAALEAGDEDVPRLEGGHHGRVPGRSYGRVIGLHAAWTSTHGWQPAVVKPASSGSMVMIDAPS